MLLKEYKNKKKIVCYILTYERDNKKIFKVCTGKPSDASCISWTYDNLENAQRTAQEYLDNTINFFKGVFTC